MAEIIAEFRPQIVNKLFPRVASEKRRRKMPAKSKAQQMAAGAALSAKRGEAKVGSLKGASKEMYKSMNQRQLEEFAGTKRKGKPVHVKPH
jgi:hypothetical protein